MFRSPLQDTRSQHLSCVSIGQGSYPAKPLWQVRNQLQPPNHQLRKEERQLMASLLKLCCEEADTDPLTPSGDTSETPISDTTAESLSTSTNASSKMCQKFNIRTPDKAALVMELVRDMKTLEREPTTNLASIEEIKEEMAFFGQIIHCYNCVFGLLRRTRTIFSTEERTELQGAIKIWKSVWATQRIWEKQTASVTPKSHGLWFEIQPQLTYLGRFYHLMEDPIKELHKIDRLMDAVYCHLRDYEFREESKKKKEAIGKNSQVQKQL